MRFNHDQAQPRLSLTVFITNDCYSANPGKISPWPKIFPFIQIFNGIKLYFFRKTSKYKYKYLTYFVYFRGFEVQRNWSKSNKVPKF